MRFKEKVKGGPINCILYKAVSVQTIISCLVFVPATIVEPLDSLNEPAVFVAFGSNSNKFSWSEKVISIESTAPVLAVPALLIGSEPSTIKCLSVSDVKTCKAFVGTKLAPATVDNSTALVSKPLSCTHL